MKIRLDKYLADMKVGTRSEVKEYVRRGRVAVAGQVVRTADIKIDSDSDEVTFDGQRVGYVEYEYYMLNKPGGVITATADKNEKTVTDLIDSRRKDLFPVGRLDKDTVGLLLVTNDGELAHRLLAPKSHVDKTYFAKVKGLITDENVRQFADGLKVDDELTAMPAVLEVLSYNELTGESEVNVTIHEGKFHQIKRMFIAIGSEVTYLKRITFGSLVLDEALAEGTSRLLTQDELDVLRSDAGQ